MAAANERGQYGDAENSKGVGGILIGFGIAVGIYALSPGARHYYRHGRLPPHRG